jgi:hypothetical protein
VSAWPEAPTTSTRLRTRRCGIRAWAPCQLSPPAATSGADSDILLSYHSRTIAYFIKPIDLDAFEQVVDRIRHFYGELVTLPHVT